MKVNSAITSTPLPREGGGSYVGYGIRLTAEDGSASTVEDISPDRERVEALARLFEAEQLEPVHLFDAVYDALSDGALL